MDDAIPAVVVIDGSRFADYLGFVTEFNRSYLAVFAGPPWDGDDFNDLDELLEVPPERYVIRWINSAKSRTDLGYQAMVDFKRRRLEACQAAFPSVGFMQDEYRDQIAAASAHQGPTLFDYLVDQLEYEEHCDLILE
jgi:hypothetical protein